MNRRWLCSDVWMDILPSFDHAQLGLKMALLSDRFDVLVDAHFDGKSELTIWRQIRIRKDEGPKAKLSVRIDGKFVAFPFPDCPLPNKIRFKKLQIYYIDHSVLAFVRSNKHIWDRNGTNLELSIENEQPIWDVLTSEIWPVFETTIRHFGFTSGAYLDNLRRRISPTILTDCDQLNSIKFGALFPDGIADDGPNATAGQAVTKWLHTPSKDGQPKRLLRYDYVGPLNLGWVNNFKETFRRATTSVSYTIQFYFLVGTMPTEQFELMNERTNEKLTLKQKTEASSNEIVCNWLLQRCPIIGETATVPAIKWEVSVNPSANLNSIRFDLWNFDKSIGPLSPPVEEEKEDEADQSNKNVV